MALEAGTKLGPYEILSPLGAGGMGEVYRARDSKLGREVAIKVLPEEFTQHPQKLARFEREARLLAALNHPGIATLYGVEEAENQPFLVMELVEGETLADRISRGAVPVDEALQISQQIAEALEAAHEKGVIHRDLKPANIKVDPEGKVKVLDFGLAKAFADEVPESELSQSPTLSRDATRAGVILGTAAYMSPEQAKGKTVDKRSDIFSFGIVLYEMLTAKKAFAGEDVPEVLASIINKAPDWKALPSDLDPRLQNLLRRCMRKDRKKRLRDIGDARNEIEEILAVPVKAVASERGGPRATTRWQAIAGVLVLALLATAWILWPQENPPQTAVRLSVDPGALDGQVHTGPGGMLAFSPDGRRLAFVGRMPDGSTHLYVRSLDNLEATRLRGTEGAGSPFFSPDGQWLGFFTAGALKKVSASGGAPLAIADVPNGRGGTWGSDDTIVYSPASAAGLYRVPASGGTSVELTQLSEGELSHRWPSFLPNGQAVLFVAGGPGGFIDDGRIEVVSLDTGARKVLHRGGTYPRYASGHVLYARESTLFAIPFDSDRMEPIGEPSPLFEGVRQAPASVGLAYYAVADGGTVAYVPAAAQSSRRLVWVDREGREEILAAEPRAYTYPRISPDGSQVAIEVRDQERDIWILDLPRKTLRRLTFSPEADYYPVWTRDGQRVAFSSDRGGPFNLFWKAADGTGTIERLTESENSQFSYVISPNGDRLVFRENHPGRGNDLRMRSMDEEGSIESLVATDFNERDAEISPDGRWLAYASNASGQSEIYVQPFPNVNEGRWQISTTGGTRPLWARDGSELFYLDAGGQLTAVTVRPNSRFDFGSPETVLEGSYYAPAGYARTYDVTPNGDRFLMIMESDEADGASSGELIVVLNWHEELKRLVPVE